jgi:S1-C subfamily serine protease
MRKPLPALLTGLCLLAITVLPTATAQTSPVRLKLRVVLVDKDLNQKPVPFFVVTLHPAAQPSATTDLKTALDGTAERDLPPGRYSVTTPTFVELTGKRFTWNLELELKGAEQQLTLSNDNAKAEEIARLTAPVSTAASGDLTAQFKHLKNTVVTVLSESGHGTGFFADSKGLVLTNQHVIGSSEYLAVQFDAQHKIAARLLASDAQKDVALLWVNMGALPDAEAALLNGVGTTKAAVQEGERVFTIGSPLSLEKILTTGIVSKVQARAIISDVNINPGNSGGPLFNSAGTVLGLTTFSARADSGSGVSGIVRIEEALPLLEQGRAKLTGTPPPVALLPVEPATPYPVSGLTAALKEEKFDTKPYYFSGGDFNIALSTPPLDYREHEEKRLRAERERNKRNKKKNNRAEENTESEEAPKEWEAAAGEHKAVFGIIVFPKAKEGFGSAFGRALSPYSAAKLKFKADFYKMRLFCGDREIQPIHPGRVPLTVSMRTAAVRMNDSTFYGVYSYPPDAVSPECGQVRLEIYSSKEDSQASVKVFDAKTVERVWADFDPFRKAQSVVAAPPIAKP